jgi:SAM-dependent methyltransferase
VQPLLSDSLAWFSERYRRLRHRLARQPAVGRVRLGHFRRLQPISGQFGFDRGLCIDRFYIERFLAQHRADIHGRVLEVADSAYTTRFGGAQVTRADVLNIVAEPGTTVVMDLAVDDVPTELVDAFDCIILTQTLQMIFDVRAVVRNLPRLLKPGGVLLATIPGISQICRYPDGGPLDMWRLTLASATRLFGEAFPVDHLSVESHGNVLAAVAFLHGLAVEDLSVAELEVHDRDYQVILTVRAVKPDNASN